MSPAPFLASPGVSGGGGGEMKYGDDRVSYLVVLESQMALENIYIYKCMQYGYIRMDYWSYIYNCIQHDYMCMVYLQSIWIRF